MATIALDAMGGDHGVGAAVRAAASVSLDRDIGVLLVGDQAEIDAELRRQRYDASYLSVHHASQAVGMCDNPRAALDAHMISIHDCGFLPEGHPATAAGTPGRAANVLGRYMKAATAASRAPAAAEV